MNAPFQFSLVVLYLMASSALPITGRGSIGVFWRVFMPMFAVSFAAVVWSHCKTLPEYAACWVKQISDGFRLLGTLHNRIGLESRQFGKKRGFISNAFNGDRPCVSLIQTLLFSRCPSTIGRLVIPVVVNPVKSKSFGLLSHILKKCRETLGPCIADLNASSAVVRKRFARRIQAPLLEVKPYRVSGILAQMMSFVSHEIECITYH